MKKLYFFKYIGFLADRRIVVIARSKKRATELALEIARKEPSFRDDSDVDFLSEHPIPEAEEFGILLENIY